MRFDIITIFPQIFDSYFKESLIKRALEKRLIEIKIHDLRKWATDRHKTVDDKPFGGGIGMVMKVEPIFKAVNSIKKRKGEKRKIILFSPGVKKFNQRLAQRWAKLDRLIMICGRYEGVDARVAKYIADEEISIGDYVLMGGELPAMVVIETVARLVPGVVGKTCFLRERAVKEGFVEYPQYTRPENFRGWKVPKVLLSGHHKKIQAWRERHKKIIEK